MDKQLKLKNKERLYLLSLVKEDIRKVESNQKSCGIAKLTTMYTVRENLRVNRIVTYKPTLSEAKIEANNHYKQLMKLIKKSISGLNKG